MSLEDRPRFAHDDDWMRWDGINRIKDRIHDHLVEVVGMEPGSLELFFEERKEFEKELQAKPSMRERQAKMVNPSGTHPRTLNFSEAQRAYLKEKLAGVNDPVGRSILDMLG